MEKKKMTTVKMAVAGLIIFIVILGIFIVKSRNSEVNLANESLDWPDTAGVITESYVDKYDDEGTTWFEPVLKYTYKVNGKTFTGNRIAFYELEKTEKEWAEAFIGDYPKGHTVRVYYNPENPQISIIERKAMPLSRVQIITLVLTLFMPVVIIIAAVIIIRKMKADYRGRVWHG